MKTFDTKDIFLWTNCEKAEQYVGKPGYFGNDIKELEDAINHKKSNKLTEIYPKVLEEYDDFPFCENDRTYYRYFLPADKVKAVEEKKYRPFKDIGEFLFYYKIGDLIQLKVKPKDIETENDGGEISGLFVGYRTYKDENTMYVLIGGLYFQLNDVDEMSTLQIKNRNNEWQPFGVEE